MCATIAVGLIDERTFDVQAQHTRQAFVDRALGGAHGGVDGAQFVAYQSRQVTGRAVSSVRASDGGYTFNGGVIIEQHATSTIDLSINEAR